MRSLHDHLPLRDFLHDTRHQLQARWHALDAYDTRYYSVEESLLRARVLDGLESVAQLIAQLLDTNATRDFDERL